MFIRLRAASAERGFSSSQLRQDAIRQPFRGRGAVQSCCGLENPRSGAWTLVEMAVAVGVFSIASAAMASLFYFGLISFASMTNYSMLDKNNRIAMDTLTREVRQANEVLAYSTNPPSLTILTGTNTPDGAHHTVTYTFSGGSRDMVRNDLNDGSSIVLLTNCDLLNFSLFMRCPSNGNFDIYPVATTNWQQTVKAVQFTWKTSISIPQGLVNSEDIQTARIIIRKQDNGN